MTDEYFKEKAQEIVETVEEAYKKGWSLSSIHIESLIQSTLKKVAEDQKDICAIEKAIQNS